MRPSFSPFDAADLCLADAVLNRDFLLRADVPADSTDLLLGQLGLAVFDAPLSCLAAFCVSVGHVIGVSAEKHVIRSDAGPDIAVVADAEALGDGAVVEFPSEAVGFNRRAVHFELPVAVGERASQPLPASVRLANLGPKAFNLSSHISLHRGLVGQERRGLDRPGASPVMAQRAGESKSCASF